MERHEANELVFSLSPSQGERPQGVGTLCCSEWVGERGPFCRLSHPVRWQTLTWDSKSQVADLAHWPYWSGRKGCWTDEHGQHQSRFGDRYKVPASPADGKLETIASIADPSGDKRIKTRVVTENLGHKEIHGMTAYGMKTTMTPLESGGSSAIPETTTELWKSSEFNLKLLQVTSGPKYGLERVELSDLQRADPLAPAPGRRGQGLPPATAIPR